LGTTPQSCDVSRRFEIVKIDTASHRVAHGGKTVYGAAVGILMLETAFPRILGDLGKAQTWPFPVLYKVVPGATGPRVTHASRQEQSRDLLDAFLAAGDELVRAGADGLMTSCGFLSVYQQELATHCKVPVAASSLMQIPMVERTLPRGQQVGVITFDSSLLTPDHLVAVGARPDVPIVGLQDGREIWHVQWNEETELNVDAAREDVLDAGAKLMSLHPSTGAIVLECTNLHPYASALRARFGVPIFDVVSLGKWFQAGLQPAFSHPEI
jgi:hypothetical protein